MKKDKELFHYTTSLAGSIPGWKASRPMGVNSYDALSKAIENEIIRSVSDITV